MNRYGVKEVEYSMIQSVQDYNRFLSENPYQGTVSAWDIIKLQKRLDYNDAPVTLMARFSLAYLLLETTNSDSNSIRNRITSNYISGIYHSDY